MFQRTFKKSFIVAAVTVALDFTFHYFLTNPLETLTYFIIKFLLSFFIASAMFASAAYIAQPEKRYITIPAFALLFSVLMSTYYRSWELFEALAPWGSRAPDIVGLLRGSVLFIAAWGLAHASFFVIGVLVANRFVRNGDNV